MVAAIFQLLVFTYYLAYITRQYGVLSSISESYYMLGKKSGYFTLFCFLLAFPMFLHSREFNPGLAVEADYTWLFFVSMLLSFTGAAAAFKRPVTDVVHFVGAACGILGAIVGIALQYNMPLLILGWFISSAIAAGFKNPVYWVEVVSFAWVMVGLLILYA